MGDLSDIRQNANPAYNKKNQLDDKKREGYVYASYGPEKYLKDAVISAHTLRRHDRSRPIALVCCDEHRETLESYSFDHPFDLIIRMEPDHQSIVGFKHNLHHYMPFQRNLYLDSDIIWCRDPDNVWLALKPYPYTITGQDSADVFFGSHKNIGIILDILLFRRQRTLKKFGLSYLARVQTGIIYAADPEVTRQVNQLASDLLNRKADTHFVSRKKEKGRSLESCEWSLGMAVSKMNLYVYPWFNAQESIQLDYIRPLTEANKDFSTVSCKYFCNPFIHSLRGIKSSTIRKLLFGVFRILPRSNDHIWVTPYVLHFGWKHQKQWFDAFAAREWEKLIEKHPVDDYT